MPRFRSRLRVGSGELSPPVPVCAILAVVLLASVGPDGAAPAAVHNRDLAPAAVTVMWRQMLPPRAPQSLQVLRVLCGNGHIKRHRPAHVRQCSGAEG